MSLNIYVIDDGEQFWYSAESRGDALKMYLEPLIPGEIDLENLDESKLPCPLAEIEIEELSSDTLLKIKDGDTGEVSEKTAAEWAAEGAGYIAGTVW